MYEYRILVSKKNKSILGNFVDAIREKELGRKGIKKKIKNLKKSEYGTNWQNVDNDWYGGLYKTRPTLHSNFVEYFKNKKNIKTVLEVGCGTGIYPIKFKNLFSDIEYVGVDFGKPNIDFCKKRSQFQFICGDFIKMDLTQKYDLIFSHAVIDHVYDIENFLIKIIKATKKYAYVSAYRGFFPNLNKNRMEWDNQKGCFYNDLSVNEIKRILIENGLKNTEFKIREQENGMDLSKSYAIGLKGTETIIEINKIIDEDGK
jgi:SAM-dependent methyltransferase